MKSQQLKNALKCLCYSFLVSTLLVTSYTRVSAEETQGSRSRARLSLPENIPATSKANCPNCTPPAELYTCPKAPAQGVPSSFDVDKDRFIGHGDLFKVNRFLQLNGPRAANGAREDVNNDGFVNAQDASDLEAFFSIVVGSGGSLPDVCGICGGDGTSCLDCANVPNGGATVDICGVCGGQGIGECGCDLSIKKDCAGECGGTKVTDACGVCGGAGTTGCDNQCNSTKVEDECGVCGGTGPDACGVCGGNGPGECGCDLSIKKDCAGVCGGNATVDSCGVCGGTGPDACGVCGGDGPGECGCDLSVKKDCAGVCGGTSVIDDCGVCGGDGSTCEECPLFGLKLGTDGNWGYGKGWDEIKRLGRSTKEGECLNKRLDAAIFACRGATGAGTRGSYRNGLNMQDDCVMGHFAVGTGKAITISCLDGRRDADGKGNLVCRTSKNWLQTTAYMIREGYVFFNSNCEAVTPPDLEQAKECIVANLWYRVSPISLLMDSDSLPSDSTIANFSLDPKNCPGCVYEWKASEKAPLLVYDPEHTGKISSATQLFGNWTFGGKRFASLDQSSQESSKWTDGYEALGSLDANQDGVVAGAELEPLALWFDKNRDGVSDAGEVQKLTEAGIKSLSYKGGVKDSVTGDIILTQGYTREVNGKTVKGTSVDWYADGALSAQELIGSRMMEASFGSAGERAETSTVQTSDVSKEVPSDSLSGVWNWKTIVGNQTLGGAFVIQIKDGVFSGHALSESAFDASIAKDAKSVLAIKYFEGEVRNGVYHFTIPSAEGELRSEFRLVNNGTELEGQTWATSSKQGKAGSITYKWVGINK